VQRFLAGEVQTYSNYEGFDLVIAGDTLLYAKSTLDITPNVLAVVLTKPAICRRRPGGGSRARRAAQNHPPARNRDRRRVSLFSRLPACKPANTAFGDLAVRFGLVLARGRRRSFVARLPCCNPRQCRRGSHQFFSPTRITASTCRPRRQSRSF